MATVIKLTATAATPQNGGKEYVARIKGRDSKFTFRREFLGIKKGKYRERAEYLTDEPGLYLCVSYDKDDVKHDIFHHIIPKGTGADLDDRIVTREEAFQLAGQMDEREASPYGMRYDDCDFEFLDLGGEG